MMKNFTPRAQQVLALSKKEADRLHQHSIEPEHLLLGLIGLGGGTAVDVLRKKGLDLEAVRTEVENVGGIGSGKLTEITPFTLRVKRVLELATEEAHGLNSSYVDTEHLLLGILGEEDGGAAGVLKNRNVKVEEIRSAIRESRRC